MCRHVPIHYKVRLGRAGRECSRSVASGGRSPPCCRAVPTTPCATATIGSKRYARSPYADLHPITHRKEFTEQAEASGLVRSESGEPTELPSSGTSGIGGGTGTGTYRCSKCGQLKKNHVCTAIATGEARPKSEDKRRPERARPEVLNVCP